MNLENEKLVDLVAYSAKGAKIISRNTFYSLPHDEALINVHKIANYSPDDETLKTALVLKLDASQMDLFARRILLGNIITVQIIKFLNIA